MDATLERLRRTLDDAIAGMSAEELNWHPAAKWCAMEVLEHLYLTYTGTIKGFEKAADKGSPLASRVIWGHRWRAFVVTGLGYLPSGREAPASTKPRGLGKETVVRELGSKIGAMDEIIASCESRFGSKTKLLDHPFLGPLTGQEWRKFHLVHGLHHAKQIQGLRAAWPDVARKKYS